jgi:glycosyltransferase involved in cell wall biosynthesis
MDGVRDCAARLDPGLSVTWPEIEVRKGDTLGNARRFRRALRSLRPDLLLTHNWGSIEWALANLPRLARQVHIEDGFGPEERSAQLPRRVWMRRLLLRRATVVVPSRTLWRIATEAWRLPERRLRYVPNGVDLQRFVPRAGAPAQDGPVIGVVAALRPEKNLARLLRAFRHVPAESGATLVIAGDGPERVALGALATELGLGQRVRFLGEVADPAALYQGLDVFALSSDTEQMPLSILEAMAAGLPVAATDVGDVRAMLSEENGPCVVPREDAALGAALARLAVAPALRAGLGAANRRKAEAEFDERVMIATYRQMFMGP